MDALFKPIVDPKHSECLTPFQYYVSILGSLMNLGFAILLSGVQAATSPLGCGESGTDKLPPSYVHAKCPNLPLEFSDKDGQTQTFNYHR